MGFAISGRGGFFRGAEEAYDALGEVWESPRTVRAAGTLVVAAFLGTAALVQAARWGLLPSDLGAAVPRSHFYAAHVAFTLLLLVEVVGLVFALGRSVATSVGKQIEVFSLILLRQAFEEFSHFGEPVTWGDAAIRVPRMATDTAGALLIFVVLGLYHRAQRHLPITEEASERASFVRAKKLIALALLAGFAAIGAADGARWARGLPTWDFFEAVYTLLILSDVLLVFVSLRATSVYAVVFRNSAFAAATVFMRLGLTAPPPVNAALGLGSALFALGLTHAYNFFVLGSRRPETLPGPE